MSIQEYEALSPDDKFRIALTEGQFMDHKIEGAISYTLYSLDKFFVEIMYNVSKNKILDLNSFVQGHQLDRHTKIDAFENVDSYDNDSLGYNERERLILRLHDLKEEIADNLESENNRINDDNRRLEKQIKIEKRKVLSLWGIIIIEFIMILATL